MTTILAVRHGGRIALGGDGQVSLGQTVMKTTAQKIRKLLDGNVLVGFAGSTADAFTLLDRFESKLKDYNGNLTRAAVELAKDWRTDRVLRRLEALMLVADAKKTLLLSGTGDVIEPDGNAIGIGSGGNFAVAAARAMLQHAPDLPAQQIVRDSLLIAGRICLYTNEHLTIEELPDKS